MRKLIILAVALLFGLGMATNAMAYVTIVGSKHDLSTTGGGPMTTLTTEVCVHCHTPHNAQAAVVPLWNRSTNDNLDFTPYSSTTLSPSALAVLTLPTYNPAPISMACLTCHDGSVANSGAAGGPVNPPGDQPGGITYSGFMSAGADLTTDLSDDHPVSVSLAGAALVKPAGSGGYYLVSGDPLIRLFSGNVECASCHNVHDSDPATAPFLARSNAASAICTACHAK